MLEMPHTPDTPPHLISVTLTLNYGEIFKLMHIMKRLADTEPPEETLPENILFPHATQEDRTLHRDTFIANVMQTCRLALVQTFYPQPPKE